MKHRFLIVGLLGSVLALAIPARAYQASCVIDPGTETYQETIAYSEAMTVSVGPSVTVRLSETSIETRHFLSGFSKVWDILTVSSAFMIFIR